MGIADEARDRYAKAQRRRVEEWTELWDVSSAVANVARQVAQTRGQQGAYAPVDRELELTAEWHDQGVVVTFGDDALEFFGRLTGDKEASLRSVEFELFVVQVCRRCGRKAPFGPLPRDDDSTGLGRVLVAGEVAAAGHRCVPTTSRTSM